MKIKELIIGFIFVSGLGVLFHFAYDFLGVSILKAVFPYNESIFEHTKLIIFPALLYMIVDILIFKNKNRVFSSYVSGIIVSVIFMISAYYTYSGIIGKDVMWVNIVIFFISIILVFIYRYKKITLFEGSNSVIVLIIFLILVEMFTFFPIDIGLFKSQG